jgi:hypothetical protein
VCVCVCMCMCMWVCVCVCVFVCVCVLRCVMCVIAGCVYNNDALNLGQEALHDSTAPQKAPRPI